MKEGREYPKELLLAGVIFIIIASVVVWYKMSGKDRVIISQQDAQEKMNEYLPYKKEFQKYFVSVMATVDKVQVDFRDENSIHVMAEGQAVSSKGSAKIQIETVGTPEYRQGAFYFNPQTFDLKKFEFSGEAQENADKAGRLVRAGAKKYFGEILNEAGVQVKAEEVSLKIKEAFKNAAEETVIHHLNRHPVKTLEGAKEKIISLAIDKVEVSNGNIIIYFSLIKFTYSIMLLILSAIAAFAIMMSAPWWAQALFILGP